MNADEERRFWGSEMLESASQMPERKVVRAMNAETPQDGWFPKDAEAPMFQNLFRNGRPVGQVVYTRAGWRPYTLLELNQSGTAAKPLSGSPPTREEARRIVDFHFGRITSL